MYTALNIKTENSLLTSLIKIDDLVEFAINKGLKSLSITDNKMYGVYYFYKKCKSCGIKPIVGLEVIVDNFKLILYCKNYNGYKNLLKLTSLEGISFEKLSMYSSDLVCIVPFESMGIYDKMIPIFSSLFIGYKNEVQEELSYDNLVYMNDVFCLDKGDLFYLKYLKSIRDGIPVSQIDDVYDNYLLSYDEVCEKYPKYISNNFIIGDICNLEIEFQHDLLPKYPCPDNLDSYQYLKKLCVSGLKSIFGDTVSKVYVDRLKYELSIIEKMGFCNYFLVVWDYVKFAKESGILVGPGRGSAAGSLVSYVLNITTIDPIKYDLLFERFLNPERVTMPDIDIDFEYTRRQEVVDYCISKYGEKKVAPIITFGTLGAKQSIRDVGKSLEIPLKMVDRLCSFLDSRADLKENYKNVKVKNYLSANKELVNLYKIATRLEGLKRHTSIHAAGIVMSNVSLDEVIPLDKTHEFYTTGYSMEFLEELGLLKMDFLALKNLTLINDILREVNISFDDIPMNDGSTIKLFKSGKTSGIFQFESAGMINFLNKFRPNSFEEIVATIALYRPGPMGNIDTYIKRKRGIEVVSYIVPEIESILKPTYGIIVYQEQIMQIAQVMADYSLGEADVLRRAMSKKKEDVLLKEKDSFINRSVKKGFNFNDASLVYDLILKFASYGFNRAHSVAYAMVAYRIAYLKVHYPLFFMKELLNTNIGSEAKTREYVYECKQGIVNILKPDINISDKEYIIYDGNLVYPLTSIKSIGIQVALKILTERENGSFLSVFDFVKRCRVGKNVLEALIFSGCFELFGYNKKTLIDNLEKIVNYSELGDLFDGEEFLPIIEESAEYDKKFLMEKELEIFGFYLSNHPVTSYKRQYKTIDLIDISKYFDKSIDIVVYVDKVKELETKKGDKMCFITGSDEVATIDVVMFPRVYDNSISIHTILYLNGRVEKRYDKYQFVVNRIIDIID